MKKNSLFLKLCPLGVAIALMAGHPSAHGSSTYPVRLSGWCEPVTGDNGRSSRDGGVYRIRSGGMLSATANRQTIYVERGGSLTYIGRSSSIFAEDGAFVRVTGDANTVIVQPRARIMSTGSNAVTVVQAFDLTFNQNASLCR
jgi:hypothetical protein